MSHQVFVSYSTADQSVADAVYGRLRDRRIPCWMAPNDIPPGVRWAEAVIEAIEASAVVVMIFSSSSNASGMVSRELLLAAEKQLPILPFRIEACPASKELKFLISPHQWLDALTSPLDRHIEALGKAVKQILARQAQLQAGLRLRPIGQDFGLPPAGPVAGLIREAKRLAAAKQYGQALRVLAQALRQSPGHHEALYLGAFCYAAQKEYVKALRLLLPLRPARLEGGLEARVEALRTEIRQRLFAAVVTKNLEALATGRHDESVAQLRELVAADPDAGLYHFLLTGTLMAAREAPVEFQRTFRRSVDLLHKHGDPALGQAVDAFVNAVTHGADESTWAEYGDALADTLDEVAHVTRAPQLPNSGSPFAALAGATPIRRAAAPALRPPASLQVSTAVLSGQAEYDVFLSYATEDTNWVRENLYRRLGACRTADGTPPRIFFDSSDADLRGGQGWMDSIVRAIQSCRKFVAVYSEHYLRKEMCLYELENAHVRDPRGRLGIVVPVLIDPTAAHLIPLRVQLLRHRGIASADWFEEVREDLALTPG